MYEHSKIGASSMSRWQKCPGSVRLSEGMDDTTSIFAAEGTVAHGIAEHILNHPFDPLSPHLGETVEQDGHQITVTQEMIDAVAVYTDYIESIHTPKVSEL